MNFDVIDIKLLRDHPTESPQFGPSPSDRCIAANVQTSDDQMAAADLHLTHDLKHSIGRGHIKNEARVSGIFDVQDELDVFRAQARPLSNLLIENISRVGWGQDRDLIALKE
jgi:hypothetical protein